MKFDSSKFIIFRVENEEYGIHIDQVTSIERIQPVTPIPNAPDYVIGVINLRELITPVIDLRRILSKRVIPDVDSTRIVVVSVENKSFGLVVDAATDVLNIQKELIQQPNFPGNSQVSILGIAKVNEHLYILLDVETLLQETVALEELSNLKKQI